MTKAMIRLGIYIPPTYLFCMFIIIIVLSLIIIQMQPSSQKKKKKSDAAYEPARIKIDFSPSH